MPRSRSSASPIVSKFDPGAPAPQVIVAMRTEIIAGQTGVVKVLAPGPTRWMPRVTRPYDTAEFASGMVRRGNKRGFG